MHLEISKRAKMLEESPLQVFSAKAKAMKEKQPDAISLGVGQLWNPAPNSIKAAGIKAIQEDKTKYVPASGSNALKTLLSAKYGVTTNHVLISNGAKSVLGAILAVLIDNGDHVMVPTPYYPPFIQAVKFYGGNIIEIETEDNDFVLTEEAIKENISETGITPKILIINSPNNPTGVEYPIEELEKIAEFCKQEEILIISDECYSNFSKDKNFTFLSLNKNAIAINSVSKTYSIPGFRIGWAIAQLKIVNTARLFLENCIGCPCSVSEIAAAAALQTKGINDFEKQREIVRTWLNKMNIPFTKPNSGIYVFPNFSKFFNKDITDSTQLATFLLENAKVAVTPGEAFGNYPKYLRISYCRQENELVRALQKIEEALINL